MGRDVRTLTGESLGKFQLTNLIGQGGMSAVYRAHQASLNRDVAVKVMSPTLAADPAYIKRFVLEAKTAASLEHNNIVPVYDYGTQDNISYIVMRLLTGGTLNDRLQHRVKNSDALPSGGEAVLLLNELAKALGYAHSRGIIHRDIKANNIMFDSQGDPYVVDFGIAQAVRANTGLTGENTTIGTPTYMAPEQWRDETLTPAADQYALGILMYYVLTGRLPFYGKTPPALMQKHLNSTPPMVHELRPSIPEKAGEAVARAMSKAVDDRFANVGAFAENFQAAMGDALGTPTDFFTFVLPNAEPTAAGFRAPTVATPDKTPSAPPTVETPAAAAAPPPAPVPQPAPPAPARRAPRQRRKSPPIGLIIGLGLLAVAIIGGGTFALMQLVGPAPLASDSASDDPGITSTEPPATREANNGSGIRINPTPGAVQPGQDTPPTQITLEGPAGGGATLREDGEVLYQQLEIVVRAVEVSPLGVVASAHADGRVRLWTGGTAANPVVLREHTGVVNDLAFSADGRVLVSGGDDNAVRVWDAQAPSYRGVLAGHTNAVRGVALNRDGTTAASASEDGSVRLWDVDGGRQRRTLADGDIRFYTVAFSPDGATVAGGDNAGNITLWDVDSGDQLGVLRGHTESVRSIAFSPDGSQLVSGGTDNTVRLWDVANRSALATLRGHNNDVWRVVFAPGGNQVASGGRDNNLRTWNLANGELQETYTGHGGWVLGVDYSPDGNLLVSGGGDGTVRLWQAGP